MAAIAEQEKRESTGPHSAASDPAEGKAAIHSCMELQPNGCPPKLENGAQEVAFVMPSRRVADPKADNFDYEEFLDYLTKNAGLVQREKLREILERNASVEYLQRHGLDGRTDVESFKKCLPIVSYDDIEPDILRLVDGRASHIFTVDPISDFSLSSGTTAGKSKFIPTTFRAFESYVFLQGFLVSLYKRQIGNWREGKGFILSFAGHQIDTPGRIKAGALSTNYFRSARFRDRGDDLKKWDVSPDEVVLCDDTNQGMYCHLLCGLSQALEIFKLQATFAATVVAALRVLQNCWPEICEDIRTGTVSTKITDPAVRNAVGKILRPNPDLASMIERECVLESWQGIIPRLWKNVCFVACVLSGTMQQYVPALKHFAGKVPLISPAYAACECNFIGINLHLGCPPEDVSYMIWPESAYFEFLPLNHDRDVCGPSTTESTETVDMVDVVLGEEYELVVTNVTGLYRYKLGDVLRTKGFKNTVPIFEFVRRKDVILSVSADKTDEEELQRVVSKATQHITETSMELADFTSHADITSLPGHYVIFWEMASSRNLDPKVLQKCANTLDASLNYEYRRGRAGSIIGALELCIVEEGTVDKLKASAVHQGASPAQYKPPRCVTSPQVVETLNAAVIAKFHSQENPSALLPCVPVLSS